ncbi:MAG TPA: mechanosensitive ion channel family protein, partial [Acidimicrobiales bacterium]|nr:mechanosensitive ion channel family protein [Acidimicrobiales bacterium]
GDSAIAIRLAVKTEPAEQWQTARLLRARLKQALDEAGIEIPFPQRTVWMRSEADQGVRLLADGSGD